MLLLNFAQVSCSFCWRKWSPELTDYNPAGAHEPNLLLERNTSRLLLLPGSILGRTGRAAPLSWSVRHFVRLLVLWFFLTGFRCFSIPRSTWRRPCALVSLCVKTSPCRARSGRDNVQNVRLFIWWAVVLSATFSEQLRRNKILKKYINKERHQTKGAQYNLKSSSYIYFLQFVSLQKKLSNFSSSYIWLNIMSLCFRCNKQSAF